MSGTAPRCFLASASPRRQALLRQIGVPFGVVVPELDEACRPDEGPEAYVQRLALEKARAGLDLLAGRPASPVLGADTAVVLDGRILGKPCDREDAATMLRLLSGRRHVVLSGVALVSSGGERVGLSRSQVTFRAIAEAEIAAYWRTGEPRDKAGGYAIQGLGAVFVAHLEGSYSGVMGLPLFETCQLLQQQGIAVMLAPGGDP